MKTYFIVGNNTVSSLQIYLYYLHISNYMSYLQTRDSVSLYQNVVIRRRHYDSLEVASKSYQYLKSTQSQQISAKISISGECHKM